MMPATVERLLPYGDIDGVVRPLPYFLKCRCPKPSCEGKPFGGHQWDCVAARVPRIDLRVAVLQRSQGRS
jgi:hypothetical protein